MKNEMKKGCHHTRLQDRRLILKGSLTNKSMKKTKVSTQMCKLKRNLLIDFVYSLSNEGVKHVDSVKIKINRGVHARFLSRLQYCYHICYCKEQNLSMVAYNGLW